MTQTARKHSDPHLVRVLGQLLEHECRLHERYLALLDKERAAVTSAAVDKLQGISAEREKVYAAIEAALAKRAEVMARYGMARDVRLSTWLKDNAHPADYRALQPALAKLRSAAQRSRARSSEFVQLLKFSLGMVSGCLSILWSATQNVFKSYNPRGELQQSQHPADTRSQNVLKRA